MIGRKSAIAIAELYVSLFRQYHRPATSSGHSYYTVAYDRLYDFLFAEGYDPWFCNLARQAHNSHSTRPLQDLIMQLHTGETPLQATPNWTWDQRQHLGQVYLHNLGEDILSYWVHQSAESIQAQTDSLQKNLLRHLELDGYVYTQDRLLAPEKDVIDTEQEASLLRTLYSSLGLASQDAAFRFLDLSEEHYLAQRWEDAISNSRKFLEAVLQEAATLYSQRRDGSPLGQSVYESPSSVREYLEQAMLLEKKEKEAIAKVYGLLSHTGSHPYMAQNDQARLLRNLALTFCQFVLLRLRGALTQAA